MRKYTAKDEAELVKQVEALKILLLEALVAYQMERKQSPRYKK